MTLETTVKITGKSEKGHYKAILNGSEVWLTRSKFAHHPVEECDVGDIATAFLNVKEADDGEVIYFVDGLMRHSKEPIPFNPVDIGTVQNDPVPPPPPAAAPAPPPQRADSPGQSAALSARDISIAVQVCIKVAADLTIAEIAAGIHSDPDSISKRVYHYIRHLAAAHGQALDGKV